MAIKKKKKRKGEVWTLEDKQTVQRKGRVGAWRGGPPHLYCLEQKRMVRSIGARLRSLALTLSQGWRDLRGHSVTTYVGKLPPGAAWMWNVGAELELGTGEQPGEKGGDQEHSSKSGWM